MAEINNAHPITVIPYLSFLGNCEEALNTYIEAFGGEIYYLSRWSEKTFDVTPEQIGKVMHAEYALGNTRMAAGDTFDSENINTAIKLMIHMDSKEEATQTISVLYMDYNMSKSREEIENTHFNCRTLKLLGFC